MRGTDYVVKRVLFADRHRLRRDHAQLRPLPLALGRRRLSASLPRVLAGLQGLPAPGARPRQVEVGAVQDLPRRPRTRGHGPLAPHGGARDLGALGAAQDDHPDGRARDVLRDRVRGRDGRRGGVAAWDGRGQGGPLGRPRLLLDAAAVARPRDRALHRRLARVTDVRGQGPDARDPRRPLARSRCSSTVSST